MALIGATRGVLTTRPGDAAPARTETYSLRVAAIPGDGGRTIRNVRALAPQLQIQPVQLRIFCDFAAGPLGNFFDVQGQSLSETNVQP